MGYELTMDGLEKRGEEESDKEKNLKGVRGAKNLKRDNDGMCVCVRCEEAMQQTGIKKHL